MTVSVAGVRPQSVRLRSASHRLGLMLRHLLAPSQQGWFLLKLLSLACRRPPSPSVLTGSSLCPDLLEEIQSYWIRTHTQ